MASANADGTPREPPAREPADDADADAVVLPPGLDSGDIVLFNRRCLSMPPAGAALCALAKFSHNSRWDHVGVVVRDPASGELLFLEADFGGVKLRSLAERVRRSRSNEIAVRRLSLVRTDAMRETLHAFAQRMLGRPYEIGTGSVMARVADPVAKAERDRLHALLVAKRATVAEMDRELGGAGAALTATARRVLSVERARVAKVAAQIERKLVDELGVAGRGPLTDATADLSRVFCSELVAAAYQDLGLLDVYPIASGYNPKDFSSEQRHPPGVHLLKGSRLSDEVMLRGAPEAAGEGDGNPVVRAVRGLFGGGDDAKAREGGGGVRKRRRSGGTRVRGVGTGDPPSRDSRQLIREVLRRTPIYSKVPDEYKWSHLTKSFKARVVEPGDVVFTQGEFDDRIYVIESGAVDRFITKGADEDPVLVNSLGARNSFGLTGFSFNCVRSATIRASERTLLWSVDRPTFERFKDTSSAIQAILSEADQRMLRGLLKEHFLFRRLDKLGPNELNAFFPVKFRAGEEIFKQGERGDNFYIIKSGEVERHIRHPRRGASGGGNGNGDQSGYGFVDSGSSGGSNGDSDDPESNSLAKTLRPGQSFGELSLMYNAPRAATIRARTDTECWAISAESFHRLNLGHGTQYLRAIFERFASVVKDGESYMTASDLLKFADVAAFQDEACRKRLSSLLIRLVTSNRERDPMRTVEKNWKRPESGLDRDDDDGEPAAEVLMDFWEFVRFDLVLNHPEAEMEFAFRLADTNNSGFCSVDEMQYLLQDYADIDPIADDMLTGENKRLLKVFGKDGSRQLSSKEFQAHCKDLLPPTFLDDLQHLTHHMLNMDPSANSYLMNHADVDELAFMEPDGSPSVMGSQFVGSATSPRVTSIGGGASGSTSGGTAAGNDVSNHGGGGGGGVRSWISSAVTAALTLGQKRDGPPGTPSSAPALSGIPWGHLLSVGVSGTASRTMVAPLERLKILMQTQTLASSEVRYKGTFSGLRVMYHEETNIWRAGFRGNGANVLRIIPNAAIQLAVVDILHRAIDIRNSSLQSSGVGGGSLRKEPSKPVSAIAIGGIAGMAAAAATYPLDYVRGRLTVMNSRNEPYSGTVDGLRKSLRQEGVMSLYRGLTPTLLGVFPYVGLSFSMYEMLRPLLPRRNDGSGRPTVGSAIGGGALASAVGQFAAYPLDTVRRRMQVSGFALGPDGTVAGRGGTSMRVAFGDVVRNEGIRGLFRGLAPNLLKVAPASAVSFLCYEQMRQVVMM